MFLVVLILNNDLSASFTSHNRFFLASSISHFLLIGMVHHFDIRLRSKPMQSIMKLALMAMKTVMTMMIIIFVTIKLS